MDVRIVTNFVEEYPELLTGGKQGILQVRPFPFKPPFGLQTAHHGESPHLIQLLENGPVY